MKTLYLVRHAKSDKGNPLLKDIDRPLNDRGYKDAYAMSDFLRKEKHIPDFLLTSPAVRAYTTAIIFLKKFGLADNCLKLTDSLYEEPAEVYISEIKNTANHYKSIMLFAHNPTISEVADTFSDMAIYEYPTCGVICLEFEIENWGDISGKKGRQVFFEVPKHQV